MKFFLAEFESVSFSFKAFGATRKEALDVMVKTLKQHGDDHDWLQEDWYDIVDININEVEVGAGYRDDYKLVGGK